MQSQVSDIRRPWRAAAGVVRGRTLRASALPALAVALLTLLLVLADAGALSGRRPTSRLLLGDPHAALVVRGFHDPEQDGPRHFRWTAGESEVQLLNGGVAGEAVLGLRVGAGLAGRPAPDVSLAADDARMPVLDLADTPRRYLLLLPAGPLADGRLTLRLGSATTVVPPDTRPVGVRLEEVTLDVPVAAVLPAPTLWLAYGLTLACAALTLWRLAWPAGAALAGLVLAALVLALAQRLTPPWFAPIYLMRLAGGAAVLTALTLLALPSLERHLAWFGSPRAVRALWSAALLACALRLMGTLYPPFDAYDLSLNLGRFLRTAGGELVDTNRSFEFRSGVTVYPAGPYLALLPGLLLGLSPKLAVQGGIAVLDGLGALATGALGRRLGLGERASLLSAVLYAGLPVMLTSLWFGHTAQVYGQGLMAPLALALLAGLERDRGRAWLVAGALLAMALLSHIGVSILAVAWLGLAWLALRRPAAGRRWLRLTALLAVCGVAGVALVYGPMAQMKLAELGKVGETVAESGRLPAYNLIWRAFQISFYEIGWLLALPGLLLLAAQQRPRVRALLLWCWISASAIFWAVEMVTALQVRYMVFLAPIVCMVLGQVLSELAARGAAGRVAAWSTAAGLLALAGAAWYTGTFENVQMSMLPLLR